jgi:hypothetical protein
MTKQEKIAGWIAVIALALICLLWMLMGKRVI